MFPGHEPTLVYKDKSHLEAGISSGIYNQLTVNHTFYSENQDTKVIALHKPKTFYTTIMQCIVYTDPFN